MKKQIKLKRTIMLLAVLLFMLIPLSAFAAETTLSTTIPLKFTVKIEIYGKGSVIVEGVEYSQNAEIVVKRNERISYSILPGAGYDVRSVFYNDVDVTEQLKDGIFTALADKDGKLNVTFGEISGVPKTGEDSNLKGAIIMMMLSVAMIIVAIAWKIKNEREQP